MIFHDADGTFQHTPLNITIGVIVMSVVILLHQQSYLVCVELAPPPAGVIPRDCGGNLLSQLVDSLALLIGTLGGARAFTTMTGNAVEARRMKLAERAAAVPKEDDYDRP